VLFSFLVNRAIPSTALVCFVVPMVWTGLIEPFLIPGMRRKSGEKLRGKLMTTG